MDGVVTMTRSAPQVGTGGFMGMNRVIAGRDFDMSSA